MSTASECPGDCSWVFTELSPRDRRRIQELSQTLSIPKGEILFREGESASGIYVICDGKVKLAKHSLKGKIQILKLLGPGELLGEKTFFDREIYTAYAQTLEDSRLHFLERAPVMELLRNNPELALRFIEKLSRELKGFQDKLVEASYEGSRERLARLLLMMAKEYGQTRSDGTVDIGVELTRQELAELAGITTETAIRMLSRMRDRDLIALEGSRIRIRDREGLSALAEPFLVDLKENLF